MRQALLDRRGAHAGGSSATFPEPAPLLGWNTRDNIASMRPGYARVLDNWWPTQGELLSRGGSTLWSTYIGANPIGFLTYGATKLFMAASNGVFDITTTGGPVLVYGAVGTEPTGVNFTNSAGGTYLWVAGGTAAPAHYNGTVWAAPTITGIPDVTKAVAPWVFKRKIFFVEKGTMNAWYLATDSIAGVASKLPLGSLFPLGGQLVAGATWTNDGGSGPDDYCAFISSEGEIAVYGGIDPSSSSSWELVGVYRCGRPPSRQCFAKFGGDLIVLTQLGALPLSKITASDVLRPDIAISDAIRPTIQSALRNIVATTVNGWQAMLFPAQNALLINAYQSLSDMSTVQYVVNVVTGAWTRFVGWNARAFTVYNGELYYISGGNTYKAWNSAQSDAGNTIIRYTAKTAYKSYGSAGKLKHLPLLRPQLAYNGDITVGLAIAVDYVETTTPTTYGTVNQSSFSFWDISTWDVSLWSAQFQRLANWLEVPHEPGYMLSLHLQVETRNANLSWAGTDIIATSGTNFA